jgi:hypothetical protein
MQWSTKAIVSGLLPPSLVVHPTSCRIKATFFSFAFLFLALFSLHCSFVKIKYDLGDNIGCQQVPCSILALLSSFAVLTNLVSNKNKISNIRCSPDLLSCYHAPNSSISFKNINSSP